MKNKKSIWLIAALLLALWIAVQMGWIELEPAPPPAERPAPAASAPESALSRAIAGRRSDVQVEGRGEVVKVLPDDREGSRHQRFIVRLDSGETVLVAHNIDLARRVAGLTKGDAVEFGGEYEWTARGGVVHWTHHDPDGRHPDGWIRHRGKSYR